MRRINCPSLFADQLSGRGRRRKRRKRRRRRREKEEEGEEDEPGSDRVPEGPRMIWLVDSCKKKVTFNIVYVMSQKYISNIIIWLTDLKENLLWSNHLARGLLQKKK